MFCVQIQKKLDTAIEQSTKVYLPFMYTYLLTVPIGAIHID